MLGDSFSDGNVWQSVVMEKSRFKILTFKWDGLDKDNSLEHWIASLHTSYPTVKYIILETVERSFMNKFVAQPRLNHNKSKKSITVEEQTTKAVRDCNLLHVMPDPIYSIRSAANSFKRFDITTQSGDTFIAPLNRTDLFSNRRSGLLLFFKDDCIKKEWKPDNVRKAASTIKHIELIARSEGITFIMVVVPDKLTTYYKYIKYPVFDQYPPDVWNALEEQHVTQANLREAIALAADSTQDLYFPDNTHFSTKGYVLMGELMSKRLNEIESAVKN